MTDQPFINNFLRAHVDAGTRAYAKPFSVMLNPKHTQATQRTTAEIVLWLNQRELTWYTELRILGRKRRADIVVPELFETQVIEIHDSEERASLDAKENDYNAAGVSIACVPADHVIAIKLLKQRNGLRP